MTRTVSVLASLLLVVATLPGPLPAAELTAGVAVVEITLPIRSC